MADSTFNRDTARAAAFNAAIVAHATASRPTGFTLAEYLAACMAAFDKAFPK